MRSLKNNEKAFSQLVPLVLAVVITFAVLVVGIFVNGEISQSLEDTYPAASQRTTLQNESLGTLGTIGDNQDSVLDIVQVVVIITILAAAIGAIFLFTRFD